MISSTHISMTATDQKFNVPLEFVEALLQKDPAQLAKDTLDCFLAMNDDPRRLQQKMAEFSQALGHQVCQYELLSSPSSTESTRQPQHEVPPSGDCPMANHSDDALPLEVIRQVAESGFLSSQEIGKILILCNRQIHEQVGDDFIWSSLCGSKFPQLLQVPFLQPRSHFCPEWIFRAFSKSSRQDTPSLWPPLAPPSLRLDDLLVVAQWYRSRSDVKPCLTMELSPKQTADLLQTGQVTALTTSPLTIDTMNVDQVHVRVHCVRRDKRQCCCIHETADYSWDPAPTNGTGSLEDDILPHQQLITEAEDGFATFVDMLDVGVRRRRSERDPPSSIGHLFLGPRAPVVLHNSGKDLETRLARGDREQGGFELLVVAKACREEGTSSSPNETLPMEWNTNHTWQVQQLTFQMWANYSGQTFIYDSVGQCHKHGVTLLHILDELEGWS